MTPYNDAYGTCLETRAILTIYSGALHPGEVTRRLGIDPTSVQVAGERRVSSRGGERVIANNGWFLSSEGFITSLDVRRHLDWLLAKILPASQPLQEIQSVAGIIMSVNCIWYSRSGHGGPTLWPEQMRALAHLNLECSFDFYFLGES